MQELALVSNNNFSFFYDVSEYCDIKTTIKDVRIHTSSLILGVLFPNSKPKEVLKLAEEGSLKPTILQHMIEVTYGKVVFLSFDNVLEYYKVAEANNCFYFKTIIEDCIRKALGSVKRRDSLMKDAAFAPLLTLPDVIDEATARVVLIYDKGDYHHECIKPFINVLGLGYMNISIAATAQIYGLETISADKILWTLKFPKKVPTKGIEMKSVTDLRKLMSKKKAINTKMDAILSALKPEDKIKCSTEFLSTLKNRRGRPRNKK